MSISLVFRSERGGIGFPGADPHRPFHVDDEDFPVADAARLGSLANGFDSAFHHVVAEHDFDFHFGKEIDDIFGAAIELGMALLAAEALCFGDGNSLKACFLKKA